MEREQLSYCRICAAACGLTVTVDDEQVIRVRGDAEHPVSRGYTCSKGRGLAAWHHSPARLDRPAVHGREVAWDEALDDVAAVLRDTIDGSGPDAVALYLATGMAYDSAGQIATGTFFGALGSSSFYSAVTVDNAPVLVAAELVTGNAMMSPLLGPDQPRAAPPRRHQSGRLARLRHHAARPGELPARLPSRRRAHLGRRSTPHRERDGGRPAPGHPAGERCRRARGTGRARCSTAAPTPTSCATTARSDDVDALRRVVEPFTVARAAAAAGIDGAALDALIDDLRAHPGRVAVMCGTGALMATDGILVEWLKWVLLIVTGSLDRPGGMRFPRGTLNPMRPPRARPAAAPRARPAGPSCPGSRTRSRRSRWPTRSRPATSGC